MDISYNSIIELLHRKEEHDRIRRDKKDNFEAQHTSRRWDGSLYRPVVDESLIGRVPGWKEQVAWPDGRPFAACLTHDVDTARIRSHGELLRKMKLKLRSENCSAKKIHSLSALFGLRHTPLRTDIFTPWIKEEQKYEFTSSFFVSAFPENEAHSYDNTYKWTDRSYYQGEECPFSEVIRDLADQGCDIGLHGSYNSAKNFDFLARQKEDVEKIMGQEVITSRQHNLHFDIRITPFILEKAGIKADSTLGFNRDIGFRSGTSYPHLLWDNERQRRIDVLEICLILQDGALLRLDNLDMNVKVAFLLCREIIDRVAAVRGVVTLLWHPESFIRPGWFELYQKLLAYIHEKGGWGTSTRNIYEWWTGRRLNERLIEALANLQ